MNFNPLVKILEYINHSSAASEVIGAVRQAQNWIGRNIAREAVEQAGQIAAGAEILSAWALLHSESLGGWQNPDYINGYMRNPEDGQWYSSPPQPSYGVWEWSGKANAATTETLNTLRAANQSHNEIEHLSPDVENVQIGGYISIITQVIPALLKYIDDSTSTAYTIATLIPTPRRDPLVLDLDGDGIESVGLNAITPLMFDLTGSGVKTSVGWIKPDDGFLVLDRNGNGTIDTGAELFGDATSLSGGGTATNGFTALADLDSNTDGKISSSDTQFANLKVWRDLNQDGLSQSGELFALDSLNIAAINLAASHTTQTLPNGNTITDLGFYVRTDGIPITAAAQSLSTKSRRWWSGGRHVIGGAVNEDEWKRAA